MRPRDEWTGADRVSNTELKAAIARARLDTAAEALRRAILKLRPGDTLEITRNADYPLLTVTHYRTDGEEAPPLDDATRADLDSRRRPPCTCGAGAGPRAVAKHDADCPLAGVNDVGLE